MLCMIYIYIYVCIYIDMYIYIYIVICSAICRYIITTSLRSHSNDGLYMGNRPKMAFSGS